MPGGFATADERWLAGLMAATPLASLWPRGGRLSTAGARALAAAYAAAVAAAGTAMAALRGKRTAQVEKFPKLRRAYIRADAVIRQVMRGQASAELLTGKSAEEHLLTDKSA